MSNDRYEKIRKALAMGPTPGPFSVSRSHSPGNQELIIYLTYKDEYGLPEYYCTVRSRLGGELGVEANAALIASCDPDTIRELLDERDQLAAALEAAQADAARWRYIRRKLCLTGNGDGTCAMQAINLPANIQGWPEPGQVAEFCDAAIDAAIEAAMSKENSDD